MRWYLGTEVVEVYAVANRIFHAQEVEVETGGMVSLVFANGVFATINCSWSRPSTWPSWGGLSFDLVTDRGVVHVDAFKQNLTIFNTPAPQEREGEQLRASSALHDWSSGRGDRAPGAQWLFWGSDANQLMIEEFIAALREHRSPKVTGEDGLRAVYVVEAAYRSIQERKPIRL
jgi:predicted dehydrogenase